MSAKYLAPDELATWQRMQTVIERLRREVGRGLREDADLSEAEFAVLAHLVEAGGSVRPSDCAHAIGWDSSRLAHQLGRMERRGLIVRSPESGGDGRASTVALTHEGRTAHRRAVGPHLRAAKRWFADALTESQMTALSEILSALDANAAAIAAQEEAR